MLLIIAFKLSNSNTVVSGIVLSFTIPAIIFGIFAGAYVDRWDKKRVLFGTNAIRAILLIILAFSHTNLYIIYILSFVISIVTQFFIPAETPVIPLVVEKNLLLSANALFSMGIYGSILVAYALSGPFLLIFGSQFAFFILAAFFLIAAFFVTLLKIDKKKEKLIKKQGLSFRLSPTEEIHNAFKMIVKTKEVYGSLFLLTLSQLLILILAVIGPGFASQVLGIKVDELPLFFVTPAAVGMVAGAVILGNFFHNYSRQRLATLGVFLGGLSISLLPYGSKVTSKEIVYTINSYLPHVLTINILHIVIVLAFILGIANALIFVPSNTLLQEKTSDELRGKVYGSLNSLVGIFSLFPIILVGELADNVGVGHTLSGIGLILIILSAIRFLFK